MRRYEMMVILTDLLEEEAATALYEQIKEHVANEGGSMIDEAWWGKRELMHEIKKRNFGWYGVIDFHAEHDAVVEVERRLRINDDVLRFKTVRPETRVRASA